MNWLQFHKHINYKVLFVLVLLLAFLLRIFLITTRSIPFAFDMGRDLLWAKDISFYHNLTLIGPEGSIWGVYFGPLWFYLLSIPLIITNGNPLSAVYTTSIMVMLTGLFSYLLFKNRLQPSGALMLTIILVFNAALIGISTFAFHANLLPLFTLLLIYFAFLAIAKDVKMISLSLFFASLMFHADPAPAIVFSTIPVVTYFAFSLYKKGKKLTVFLLSSIAYLLPFSPQIIFELRNNFYETRALIAYFQGNNPSLSGQLPLFQRILNRSEIFYSLFVSGFSGDNKFLALIFLIFITTGVYLFIKTNRNINLKILFKLNGLALLTIYIIFTFIITVEVKNWYLFGVPVLYSILITYSLFGLKKYKNIYPIFLIIFVIINVYSFFHLNKNFVNDPALLINQEKALSLIYNDTKNSNFSVYTYTPTIYDFNYQYLFWWEGVAQGKGLPKDFAYLPNQPSYVKNKYIYAKDSSPTNTIYLIIENAKSNKFYTIDDWTENFNKYNLIWEKDISNAIKVQKRMFE